MSSEDLRARLIFACNCLTKTNELNFHAHWCRYRLYCEAHERIAVLEQLLQEHGITEK